MEKTVLHVSGPAHKRKHTLDLLISHKDDELVSAVSIHDDLPSDHSAVRCSV